MGWVKVCSLCSFLQFQSIASSETLPPTRLQMNRQATWIFLIITQITLFFFLNRDIFTCNTTGGATQVAAQEKEELQPSGIYETHSRRTKVRTQRWYTGEISWDLSQCFKSRELIKLWKQAFSPALFTWNWKDKYPSAGTPKAPPRPWGNLRACAICFLFPLTVTLSRTQKGASDFTAEVFLEGGHLPGYWAALGLICAVALSGATRIKLSPSMGSTHFPRPVPWGLTIIPTVALAPAGGLF